MAINSLALGTNNISAQLDTKLNIAGGKVLQIVRATDATNRTTTSGTFVDASISVTITPQKSDSVILVIWAVFAYSPSGDNFTDLRIADASDNGLSGAERIVLYGTSSSYIQVLQTIIGRVAPATTSAVTYKGRFASSSGTATLSNATNTGQLYAIEVSA